jgi:hypothetical protein
MGQGALRAHLYFQPQRIIILGRQHPPFAIPLDAFQGSHLIVDGLHDLPAQGCLPQKTRREQDQSDSYRHKQYGRTSNSTPEDHGSRLLARNRTEAEPQENQASRRADGHQVSQEQEHRPAGCLALPLRQADSHRRQGRDECCGDGNAW